MRRPHNPEAGRAVPAFDVPHIPNVSFIYELPFRRGKTITIQNPLRSHSAGGWKMGGILNSRPGAPLTPVLNADNENTGSLSQPPNLAGDTQVDNPNPWQRFNTKAFVLPERHTSGSAGRNILRGSSRATQNLLLCTSFPLRDDLFNAVKHPVLNDSGTAFDTPFFGRGGSAAGERTVQMALDVIHLIAWMGVRDTSASVCQDRVP